MSEDLNQLLHRASDLPGGPALSPLPEIIRKARGRRRRQWVGTAAGAALAVAVAVAVPTALGQHRSGTAPGGPSPTAYPTSGPTTAAALAHGHWSTLATSPVLTRSGYVVVWTGQRVLVWGGEAGNGGAFADGASYDPATNRWQPIPRAPIAGRSGAAAVWTGSRLFVWGGGAGANTYQDGALYDPATRTWQQLPPAPLGARSDAQALLTGGRVVVLGGRTGTSRDALPQVAAYDPAANAWTSLAPIGQLAGGTPADLYQVAAVQAGDQIFAWIGGQTHPAPNEVGSLVEVVRYDPAAGWVRVPHRSGPTLDVIGQLLWTGREVLIPATQLFCPGLPCPRQPDSALRGVRVDPSTGDLRLIERGPIDTADGPAVWTGGALLRLGAVYDPGFGAGPPFGEVWDPTSSRWYRIPDGPTRAQPAAVLWAGNQLIVLGTASKRIGQPPVGVVLGFHA